MAHTHQDPAHQDLGRLDSLTVETLARQLAEAERTRVPVAPLTGSHQLTLADAYAVQSVNVQRRLAEGESIVGHKVGLTSRAMQQQLGVDQPDFGAVFASMVVADGAELHRSHLIAPRVEAEFAFVLGADLLHAGVTEDDVRAAISEVVISLEVIDSRIADWKILLADTIADNASSARIVTGSSVAASPDVLAALPDDIITLSVDGTDVASGPGSAVLGDPVAAVHWLATTLIGLGDGLRAGEVVLAGAVHAALDITPGTTVRATSPMLGDVTMHVV